MKLIAKALSLFALVLTCSVPVAAHADLLEDILDRQKIRVGVSLFTPWAVKDKNGNLTGFEIEVANKLAQDMGVETEFKVYAWPDIIPALNRSEIDVIIAGMSITPGRALQINFTLPYAESGVALATNTAMTEDIKDLGELNRPQIMVTAVAKTLGSDVAKLMFDDADLRIVASSDEAAKALIDGKTHAYIGASVEATMLALKHPGKVAGLFVDLVSQQAAFVGRDLQARILPGDDHGRCQQHRQSEPMPMIHATDKPAQTRQPIGIVGRRRRRMGQHGPAGGNN